MTTITADKPTDKTAAATIKELRKQNAYLQQQLDMWRVRASFLESELEALREDIAEEPGEDDDEPGETE